MKKLFTFLTLLCVSLSFSQGYYIWSEATQSLSWKQPTWNKTTNDKVQDIDIYIYKFDNNNFNADWAVCAFGKEEIDCLKKAISLNGKIRIGFENSMLMPNGEIAPNNHTKVKAVKELLNLN